MLTLTQCLTQRLNNYVRKKFIGNSEGWEMWISKAKRFKGRYQAGWKA